MIQSTRRTFLRHSAAATFGAATWNWTSSLHAAEANQRLTLGLIGCGGQGNNLAKTFVNLADFAYVCDPDETRCRQTQQKVGTSRPYPTCAACWMTNQSMRS